jgi:hypothetical protein
MAYIISSVDGQQAEEVIGYVCDLWFEGGGTSVIGKIDIPDGSTAWKSIF